MYILTMVSQANGLTLEEVISDIPHDAAAIVVYVLIAGSVYLLWWANRRSGKTGGPSPDSADRSNDEASPSDRSDPGLRDDAADAPDARIARE